MGREEKRYQVKYTVNGKSGFMIVVNAIGTIEAKNIAMGEICGMPGYAGKRISITSVIQIK